MEYPLFGSKAETSPYFLMSNMVSLLTQIQFPSSWPNIALQRQAADTISRLAQDDMLPGCLPAPENIFRAFREAPMQQVSVCIIGLDPYPNREDACGLAFSSPATKIPASLRNLFKELGADLGIPFPETGDLSYLAAQNVLLANVGLTIGGNGKSHLPYWREFARAWIEALAADHPLVWSLLGKEAQAWKPSIEASDLGHVIVETPHPSPLSAHRCGFFGSKPFSQINAGLRHLGRDEINWSPPSAPSLF